MEVLYALFRYKVGLILAASGVFFIVLGGYSYLKPFINPSRVTVLSNSSEIKELTVDIQGAINKPGVYKMLSGDRIQDLLDKAGGFSSEYDTKWVEINLNRAKKVSDGEKVYIPSINEQIYTSRKANIKSNLININAASQTEIESIAGIGPGIAVKIINARPYQDLDELVIRKLISPKLYSQIKSQLSLW